MNVLTRFNPSRPAVVKTRLNVRAEPSLGAKRVSRLEPGDPMQIDAIVAGDSFLGQDRWLQLAGTSLFAWSGGATLTESLPTVPPGPVAGAAPKVSTRQDGTILPLSAAEIATVFSSFTFHAASPKGAVTIDPPWPGTNIVTVNFPGFTRPGFRNLEVHRLAAPHFTAVFAEILQSGLADRLLTCGGTFVPRHIGWDPTKPLSSHSWGIAIDLNVAWNGYGAAPALPGEIGSLRDIVPIFARHGFAWGGHFHSKPDGMHFELARRDP